MPKVSVIMPVYNVEAYLRQCLDSVVNQTLRDIEIICVDDGSTDGSAAILDEYAAKDPRVKVIRREHTNAGECRNAGIDVATGEWLFFSDADDFSGAEMLARMTSAPGAEGADVVVAGHRILEEGKVFAKRLAPRFLKDCGDENGACRLWLFLDAGVMPWNKLFRRAFVRALGVRFQSVPRHNDMRFVCCGLAAARRIAVSNTCGYVYRRGRQGGITESGSGRNVFLFADVLLSVRAELERLGLWERAALAYANMALAHCYYHLLGESDTSAFASLYSGLHGRILSELGLVGMDESAFAAKKHYAYMKATLADDTPLSLVMLVLKERYAAWKDVAYRDEQISSLQKKVSELTRKVNALSAGSAKID